VIGGGLTGGVTALHIAGELKKEKIVIVEMLDEILVGVEDFCSITLTERLREAGVEVHTGWHLEEITDKGVVCIDKKWEKYEVAADTVVLATGLRARNELVEQFKYLAPEVYIIGDCTEARRIYNTFEDAWRAVLRT